MVRLTVCLRWSSRAICFKSRSLAPTALGMTSALASEKKRRKGMAAIRAQGE
jgi:hypothetical protein